MLLLAASAMVCLLWLEARYTRDHGAALAELQSIRATVYFEPSVPDSLDSVFMRLFHDADLRQDVVAVHLSKESQLKALPVLARLRALPNLEIGKGRIGMHDANHIAQIQGLKLLTFRDAVVGPEALARITARIPECEVIQDGIHCAGPDRGTVARWHERRKHFSYQ